LHLTVPFMNRLNLTESATFSFLTFCAFLIVLILSSVLVSDVLVALPSFKAPSTLDMVIKAVP
jgi:hypothetical protein